MTRGKVSGHHRLRTAARGRQPARTMLGAATVAAVALSVLHDGPRAPADSHGAVGFVVGGRAMHTAAVTPDAGRHRPTTRCSAGRTHDRPGCAESSVRPLTVANVATKAVPATVRAPRSRWPAAAPPTTAPTTAPTPCPVETPTVPTGPVALATTAPLATGWGPGWPTAGARYDLPLTLILRILVTVR